MSSLNAVPVSAQDAAAAADRQVAEERYLKLNALMESLQVTQDAQRKRISVLTEELQRLRDEQAKHAGKQYATPDDLNRLAEKIKELDQKREADKELILEEIKKLGKTLSSVPPTGSKSSKKETAGKEKEHSSAPAVEEKGFEYIVQKGDYLGTIVAAYNEEFKKQGKKAITIKQVQDANPGLNPNAMKVGQKIFIPQPTDK